MKVDDLISIEKELNIKLPESYKKIIVDNPLSDKNKFPHVYDSFIDDAKEIIKINLNLRENGLQNKVWPGNLYVIGINGANNYYFIALNEKDNGNIYFFTEEQKFNPKNIKKYLGEKSYESFIDGRIFMQNLLDDNIKSQYTDVNEFLEKAHEEITERNKK